MPGRAPPIAAMQPGKSPKKLGGHQKRRQHGGKTRGGKANVFKGAVVIDTKIKPVLHEAIDVFKKPPQNGRSRKHPGKGFWITAGQRMTFAPIDQRVDRKDIAEPKGRKGMTPQHA